MSRTRSAVERMARQPVPTDDQVRRAVLGSEPDRLLHGIMNDARLRAVPGRGPGRRRWGPVAVVGVAVVAVLVAVAVLVLPAAVGERLLPGVADSPAVTTTTPADVLEELADRAAAQPVPEGHYDYLHLRHILPGQIVQPDGSLSPGSEIEHETEKWVAPDRKGREVRSINGEFQADEAHDPAVREDLPDDREALGRLLSWPADDFIAPGPFSSMLEIWNNQVVEGRSQAALLRLLAATDGVRIVGPATDRLGRPGVEVEVTETSEFPGDLTGEFTTTVEIRFVFDTGTGAILSSSSVELEGPDGPLPTSRSWALWLGSGRVDSTDERP